MYMPTFVTPTRLRGVVPVSLRFASLLALALLCLLPAQAAEAAKAAFDVPGDVAEKSLKRFSVQAGRNVLFSSSVTNGARTRAVKGEMTPREALDAMLAGTGLVAVQDSQTGAFSVRKETSDPNAPRAAQTSDRPTDQQAGSIVGQVSNSVTSDFIQGAVVELSGTSFRDLTDREGRYRFTGIPEGEVTLTVNAIGLDPVQVRLVMTPGGSIIRDIGLTAEIYKMSQFKVEGEREGSARANSLQREATNVKNVAATDAFGTQSEDNVGQFLQRLPGLVANFSGPSVREVMVRGISADLNTVEMDGVQLANTHWSGVNRYFDFLQASISMVDSIEVTKAPTPDMPASSIGGSINLITRTAFSRNQPRTINFSAGFSFLPDRIGNRAEHRIEEPIEKLTPTFNLSYSDLLGKNKNIGVLFSFSRNSNFASQQGTQHTYSQDLGQPGFIQSATMLIAPVGGAHLRQNTSLKLEYKYSETFRFTFAAAHNFYNETNDTRLFTLSAANSAASYVPGYSELYTQARQLPTTTASMREISYDNVSFNDRLQFNAYHRYDDIDVDYSATYSSSDAHQNFAPFERVLKGYKPKATLAISGLTNIGWIADRRGDPSWTKVTQTAGADMYNLASYPTMGVDQLHTTARANIREGRLNLRRAFQEIGVPSYVKTGLQYQQQRREKDYNGHTYRYIGPGNLAQFVDRTGWTNELMHGIRQGPWADLYYIAQHKEDNPSLWREDFAYKYSNRLRNLQDFQETILSAYAMGSVRLQDLSILGGLRVEETETAGHGPLNQLTAAELARRAAWVGTVTEEEGRRRAMAEWGNRTTAGGKYRNVFPGLHFKYAHKSGFVTRASYTTSIGRPSIATILPNLVVSDSAQRINVANTGLKPQRANNFDLNLEYYYEPIGLFSANLFLKEVSTFIFNDSSQFVGAGANNGFDGLYEGYQIVTQKNGGSARYRGFELNYQQQFTFLPGLLKGFSVNMNYTQLETKGDYGGAVATTQVAGFRPKTGNASLFYQMNRFRISLIGNWVDTFLVTTSTNPALIVYQEPRTVLNSKVTYKLTDRLNLYFNFDNMTDEPTSQYRYYKVRNSNTFRTGRIFAAGIQGRL